MGFGFTLKDRLTSERAPSRDVTTTDVVQQALRVAASQLWRAAGLMRDASGRAPAKRPDPAPLVTATAIADPAAKPNAAEPEATLTADEIQARQMTRLSDIVMSAARHGERAQLLHDRAAVRIDAALYELMQLRQHLQSVIPGMPCLGALSSSNIGAKSGAAVPGDMAGTAGGAENRRPIVRAVPAESSRSAA